MKVIQMTVRDRFPTNLVLSEIVQQAPAERGVNIGEMRTRLKLLDKIEAANGSLTLEDSEYQSLRALAEQFQFALVHKELLEAVDDVMQAKDAE